MHKYVISLFAIFMLFITAACSNYPSRNDTAYNASEAEFQVLDTNSDGGIDHLEAMSKPGLTEEFADISENGQITESEYVAWASSERSRENL